MNRSHVSSDGVTLSSCSNTFGNLLDVPRSQLYGHISSIAPYAPIAPKGALSVTSATFEDVKAIILDVCDFSASDLVPSANAVDDLGIDSVDFLDIIYELERKYGIKVPAESWMEQINAGNATTADFFTLERFSELVDELIQARGGAAAVSAQVVS